MPVVNSDIIFPNIRDSVAKTDNKNQMGKSWLKSLLNLKQASLTLNTDIKNLSTSVDSDITTLNATIATLTTYVNTLTPIASLRWSATVTEDAGWKLCNGQAISRTTYAALFAAIGTTWGVGDGSTTFNVPDWQGKTLIGMGTGSGLSPRALGDTGGEETHLLSLPEIPAHTHSYLIPTFPGGTLFVTGSGSTTVTNAGSTTGSAGGGGAHNNMQPFGVGNILIKY